MKANKGLARMFWVNRLLIACHCFLLSVCLSACSDDTYAPVTDLHGMEAIPKTGYHRVMKGETLYEIAWRYGLDYRELAARNNIKPPYLIQRDQLVRVGKARVEKKSLSKTIYYPKTNYYPVAAPQTWVPANLPRNGIAMHNTNKVLPTKVSHNDEPNYAMSHWMWPAQGKILRAYKGVNIQGQMGQPIYAAASGKVVYCGDGLRGYGNLIIIKHNSLYLSAYAHCKQTLVKEGEWVRKGQIIGKIGNTGTDKTMLHFEIRRAGKPINPLSLYR